FHVWTGPGFTGTREEQFAAFSAAKDEVMPPPHPAWTAVGATGLLAPDGVVEIQMIAYAPRAKP
ncbi:MAG: putative translation initiation inhibitor, yjgF family, partial [Caulobacter sp.]|nr:putative translation initiation inhibitor, yjgF family [Caulobacter sp.]